MTRTKLFLGHDQVNLTAAEMQIRQDNCLSLVTAEHRQRPSQRVPLRPVLDARSNVDVRHGLLTGLRGCCGRDDTEALSLHTAVRAVGLH